MCVCACVCACVRACVRACVQASHPHFLGLQIPLVGQAAASFSRLFRGGREGEGHGRDDNGGSESDESEGGHQGTASSTLPTHVLDAVPAELSALWHTFSKVVQLSTLSQTSCFGTHSQKSCHTYFQKWHHS